MSRPGRRHRRHRSSSSLDDPLRISTFDDAMSLVLGFVDCLPPSTVAVRLDDDGYVLDALRIDGSPLSVDRVAELSRHPQVGPPADPNGLGTVGGVFLVSVGATEGVLELSEDLVRRWAHTRATFEGSGVELLDWFVAGDQHIRSMALCTGVGGRW